MAARLYHDDQYDWSKPVASYWEAASGVGRTFPRLDGQVDADVAIIGGGFTGLSTAYHLARDHGVAPVVLEAGPIGWGASGRNGGFACLGSSKLSAEAMIKKFGREETVRFYGAQKEGIGLVRSISETEGFDIGRQSDGMFIIAHKPSRLAGLEHEKTTLETIVGVPARVMSAEEFGRDVFQSAEQFGALWIGAGFGLNPLKYVRGLAGVAASHGAKVFTQSCVTRWLRDGADHVLETQSGHVRAKRVVVAANGWMPEELNPALVGRLVPVISNIVVTRPLTDTELKAQNWQTESPISNTRDLLFYFRLLPDKRLLFGGRGDTTGRDEDGVPMRAELEAGFRRLFPAWRDVETTHFWRGFIAATLRATPSIGRLDVDKSVFFSFGCHGNGVAWSTWAGRALAGQIAGKGETLPAPVAGLAPRFPLPQLRIHYLRAVLGAMKLTDRWL